MPRARSLTFVAVALATVLVVACGQTPNPASPSVAGSGGQTSASTDANGSTYVLSSFDGTALLIGLNAQGKTFTASYGSTTAFKQAVLDKYAPTDPCRTAADAYNGYIQVNDTLGFNTSLTSMVTYNCKARVLVSGTAIKSFQPVP